MFPVSISVWALVLFFLPILFLGISLIRKSGNLILISVFLALISGGNSILFLGDYVGYVTEWTSKTNLTPEEALHQTENKYLFLKNFHLDFKNEKKFRSPILVRSRSGSTLYGPILNFRSVPIVSDLGSVDRLFAICYSKKEMICPLPSSGNGGVVVKESLWEKQMELFPSGSVFLVWKPGGESEIQKMGWYSLTFLFFLLFLWTFLVFFPKFTKKNS
ncbi:hypothetical protein P3G55_05845 [Leptospira sp. 96542]|nr:hypothetical protein [Leptospira sp. 96542]